MNWDDVNRGFEKLFSENKNAKVWFIPENDIVKRVPKKSFDWIMKELKRRNK